MRISERAIKDRLKNLANEQKTTVTNLLKRLYLERFLVRLAKSPVSNGFVFKGGNLLSYYLEIGRETKDFDFLLKKLDATNKALHNTFLKIIATEVNDGFELSFRSIESLAQTHMDYPGFRISLKIHFINGSLRDNIQIDVGIGDIVIPEIHDIQLLAYKEEPFFEESISILSYPPETIFAEKLETIVSKGSINSRMKDFHDLILMGREKNFINPKKLAHDIKKTFHHRETPMSLPIQFSEDEYELLNVHWSRHLKGLGVFAQKFKLPTAIETVVLEINDFLKKNDVL